ncbi:MAG: thioredoxin domain-containing protein [Planctomycetota bacterium]
MAESPHHAELVNDDGSWKYTNALARETSPYLRQHAHNPVDWVPWGDAAFAEAARRNVPIFLSIGYSTCYWCHVMERQVFENPTIARQMNDQFVCVKVDREERPDVDDIYMTATQLLTGSGGWPMSVFLTPPAPGSAPGNYASDGDAPQRKPENTVGHFRGGLLPFWAGTYIPPTPAYGRPSFPQVMNAMSQAWSDEREQVIEQGGRVADAVREQVAQGGDSSGGPVTMELVHRTVGQLRQRYDSTHGGFSGNDGPKFPTPSTVGLLLDVNHHEPDDTLEKEIKHTLDRMALGGMYDQVGGGFHRYSVDEQWLVPHFEKMLYDNGQLLELYAQAHEAWGGERGAALYARVLRETAEYLLREMVDGSSSEPSDGGAFWSAQDAEVNTKEGENYVWTPEQVREALACEEDAERLTALAMTMYGLDRGTNFQDPHHAESAPVNVLFMPRPMSELIEFADGDMGGLMRMRERINAALLQVRDTRDQPGTDDKVLTAWNGMAIAGLAKAGHALGETRYVEAARRAADAVLKHMASPDGGLRRTMWHGEAKINAFLEDYAFFVQGLIALDAALPADITRFRDEAVRLMKHAHDQFAAPQGGYFDTLADQADLFVRTRSTYDGAMPSGNSQMVHNLLALHRLTGDATYARRAVLDLRSFAGPLEQSGLGMTHMQRAAFEALSELPAAWAAALEEPAAEAPGSGKPVTVQVRPMEDVSNAYRVVLSIAEGYHVNANPASLDGLVATTVSAEAGEVEVTYPPAAIERYLFTDEPLSVYEGRIEIMVQADASVDAITLTTQACTDSACLAPETRTLKLP